MTLFSVTIPMTVLRPLAVLLAVMGAYVVEVIAYYRFAGWYYRTGPAIVRERWQTAATDAQIRQAIRPLLRADEIVGRESAEGFHFRQRAATINAWTRVVLRIEQTERGAAMHYEVRPFYSFASMILPIPWLAASAFGTSGVTLLSSAGTILVVFAIYRWIMPWDVARMGRLRAIRRALASYGLRVCERCGYDLFGHTAANRCPECGSGSSLL